MDDTTKNDDTRMNTEPVEWDWDQTIHKARSIWDNLTDEDLDVAERDFSTLLARISARTGLTTDEVMMRLNEHDPDGDSTPFETFVS